MRVPSNFVAASVVSKKTGTTVTTSSLLMFGDWFFVGPYKCAKHSRAEMVMCTLVCRCGSNFQVEANAMRIRTDRGGNELFCHKRCSNRYVSHESREPPEVKRKRAVQRGLRSKKVILEKYGSYKNLATITWSNYKARTGLSHNMHDLDVSRRIHQKRLETCKLRSKEWRDAITKKRFETHARNGTCLFGASSSKSKAAEKLFLELKASFPLLCEERPIFTIDERYYVADIFHAGRVIEFFGDYWHANPNMYDRSDVLTFPDKKVTAGEIWEKDAEKISSLRASDLEVMVVWEHDYKNDQKSVLEECSRFLNFDEGYLDHHAG